MKNPQTNAMINNTILFALNKSLFPLALPAEEFVLLFVLLTFFAAELSPTSEP